jgi:hypothetical protein
MHRFQDSFKKFITRENVSRSPLNIQKSKLAKIVNGMQGLGIHASPWFA